MLASNGLLQASCGRFPVTIASQVSTGARSRCSITSGDDDLANHTFRLARRDVLVGAGNRLAALVDGFATIRGVERCWSTVGVYDVVDQQVTACWLLPLDQHAFDAIWGV